MGSVGRKSDRFQEEIRSTPRPRLKVVPPLLLGSTVLTAINTPTTATSSGGRSGVQVIFGGKTRVACERDASPTIQSPSINNRSISFSPRRRNIRRPPASPTLSPHTLDTRNHVSNEACAETVDDDLDVLSDKNRIQARSRRPAFEAPLPSRVPLPVSPSGPPAPASGLQHFGSRLPPFSTPLQSALLDSYRRQVPSEPRDARHCMRDSATTSSSSSMLSSLHDSATDVSVELVRKKNAVLSPLHQRKSLPNQTSQSSQQQVKPNPFASQRSTIPHHQTNVAVKTYFSHNSSPARRLQSSEDSLSTSTEMSSFTDDQSSRPSMPDLLSRGQGPANPQALFWTSLPPPADKNRAQSTTSREERPQKASLPSVPSDTKYAQHLRRVAPPNELESDLGRLDSFDNDRAGGESMSPSETTDELSVSTPEAAAGETCPSDTADTSEDRTVRSSLHRYLSPCPSWGRGSIGQRRVSPPVGGMSRGAPFIPRPRSCHELLMPLKSSMRNISTANEERPPRPPLSWASSLEVSSSAPNESPGDFQTVDSNEWDRQLDDRASPLADCSSRHLDVDQAKDYLLKLVRDWNLISNTPFLAQLAQALGMRSHTSDRFDAHIATPPAPQPPAPQSTRTTKRSTWSTQSQCAVNLRPSSPRLTSETLPNLLLSNQEPLKSTIVVLPPPLPGHQPQTLKPSSDASDGMVARVATATTANAVSAEVGATTLSSSSALSGTTDAEEVQPKIVSPQSSRKTRAGLTRCRPVSETILPALKRTWTRSTSTRIDVSNSAVTANWSMTPPALRVDLRGRVGLTRPPPRHGRSRSVDSPRPLEEAVQDWWDRQIRPSNSVARKIFGSEKRRFCGIAPPPNLPPRLISTSLELHGQKLSHNFATAKLPYDLALLTALKSSSLTTPFKRQSYEGKHYSINAVRTSAGPEPLSLSSPTMLPDTNMGTEERASILTQPAQTPTVESLLTVASAQLFDQPSSAPQSFGSAAVLAQANDDRASGNRMGGTTSLTDFEEPEGRDTASKVLDLASNSNMPLSEAAHRLISSEGRLFSYDRERRSSKAMKCEISIPKSGADRGEGEASFTRVAALKKSEAAAAAGDDVGGDEVLPKLLVKKCPPSAKGKKAPPPPKKKQPPGARSGQTGKAAVDVSRFVPSPPSELLAKKVLWTPIVEEEKIKGTLWHNLLIEEAEWPLAEELFERLAAKELCMRRTSAAGDGARCGIGVGNRRNSAVTGSTPIYVWERSKDVDYRTSRFVPNYDEATGLFFANEKQAKPSGVADSAVSPKSVKKEGVLDGRRLQNLEISLKGLGLYSDCSQVMRLILDLDLEIPETSTGKPEEEKKAPARKLDVNSLSVLLSLMPTPDEIDLIKGVPREQLCKAELILLEWNAVPRIKQKIECCITLVGYSAEAEKIAFRIDRHRKMLSGLNSLLEQPSTLKALLALCLKVGNFINFHTNKRALAFELSSFPAFKRSTSFDGTSNALRFVACTIDEQFPTYWTAFTNGMEAVVDSVNLNPEETAVQIAQLEASVRKVRVEVTDQTSSHNERFIRIMTNLVERAATQLQIFRENNENIMDEIISIARLFQSSVTTIGDGTEVLKQLSNLYKDLIEARNGYRNLVQMKRSLQRLKKVSGADRRLGLPGSGDTKMNIMRKGGLLAMSDGDFTRLIDKSGPLSS